MTVSLATAEVEAQAARQRLLTTADVLMARLAPARLAHDGMAAVQQRASFVGESMVRQAYRHRSTLVVVGLAAATFLVRHRIAKLVSRHLSRDETRNAKAS